MRPGKDLDVVKYVTPLLLAVYTAARLDDEWRLSWVLGGCLSAIVVKVLKAVVNEKRPQGASKKDAGFPSSHAHTMTYLALYVALRDEPTSPLSLFLVFAALATGVDRVMRKEHTVAQVCAGFVSGALFAWAHHYWLMDGGGAEATQRMIQGKSRESIFIGLSLAAVVTVVGVKSFRRIHAN